MASPFKSTCTTQSEHAPLTHHSRSAHRELVRRRLRVLRSEPRAGHYFGRRRETRAPTASLLGSAAVTTLLPKPRRAHIVATQQADGESVLVDRHHRTLAQVKSELALALDLTEQLTGDRRCDGNEADGRPDRCRRDTCGAHRSTSMGPRDARNRRVPSRAHAIPDVLALLRAVQFSLVLFLATPGQIGFGQRNAAFRFSPASDSSSSACSSFTPSRGGYRSASHKPNPPQRDPADTERLSRRARCSRLTSLG